MSTPHLAAKVDFLLTSEVSRGLCAGDIDNDGDLDLLVTNTASLARLYRNVADRKGHWLRVDATLPAAGGRFAYGARITVRAGQKQWVQDLNPATSFLCSNDPRVHFGLGGASKYEAIEVRWPDGSVEWFEGGPADRVVPLQPGKGKPR